MNGYQRIQSVLRGEWPDKRPVMLHNFMMAAREAGMTAAQYRSDPENVARAHIEAAEKYGLDGLLIDIDTATLAGAIGGKVDFPDDEPARPEGPAIASLDQVADLEPPDIENDQRIQIWLEACRMIKKHFADELFIRGNCDQAPFSLASMMRSPAQWMMDLTDEENEHLVFKLLDHCEKATSQFIRLMAQTGVDMISNGDSPAGPEMISPAMYRKFAAPYEKKMVELTHQLNLQYMLHVCGNTGLILEDLVDLGVDGLELDFKTDINMIHNVCKDRTVLSGNLDPTGVFAHGTPDLVAQKTRELVELYKDSPRLILCSGCAVPPHTPPENVHAFIRAARES